MGVCMHMCGGGGECVCLCMCVSGCVSCGYVLVILCIFEHLLFIHLIVGAIFSILGLIF